MLLLPLPLPGCLLSAVWLSPATARRAPAAIAAATAAPQLLLQTDADALPVLVGAALRDGYGGPRACREAHGRLDQEAGFLLL